MSNLRFAVADIAEVMKALASEPRLGILQLLKEKTLCVNAITRRLGLTQPAVSQHLRVLKEAGLVKPDKRGYWMHYSVDAKALDSCRKTIDALLAVKRKKA
jgi:DNA-binding transcriptional ArsR family regulator